MSAAPVASSGTRAKVLLALVDGAMVLVAAIAAWAIRDPQDGLTNVDANPAYLLLLLGTPAIFAAAMAVQRLYVARCVARRPEELRRLAAAVVIGGLALAGVSFMLKAGVSRAWVAIVTAIALVLLVVEREVVRRLFTVLRQRRSLVRPVLIIGDNHEARSIRTMFDRSPELGYRGIGHFEAAGLHDGNFGAGDLIDDVVVAMQEGGATGVVIAGSSADLRITGQLVRALTDLGIHVEVSSPLRDIACQRLMMRNVGRFPMTYVEPVHRSGWRQTAKRAFDVVGSGFGLALLAPVMAIVAIAVRLESPGPVFFRQPRVGKDGLDFRVVKFRTMVEGAEARRAELESANEADGPLFKMKSDPRVTRIGGVLRRSSLDELPQLWNVLRGDMSLVGPRPALRSEVDQWPPSLHGRLRVKPGITGMWQVHGRSSASFDDYERLDLYYVDNWSLLADLTILCKTVPAVVSSRGAY